MKHAVALRKSCGEKLIPKKTYIFFQASFFFNDRISYLIGYSIPVFFIPQRWVMAIMGFLAVANAYTMRVCLNIAITQMVRRHAESREYEEGSCPGEAHDMASEAAVSYLTISTSFK